MLSTCKAARVWPYQELATELNGMFRTEIRPSLPAVTAGCTVENNLYQARISVEIAEHAQYEADLRFSLTVNNKS